MPRRKLGDPYDVCSIDPGNREKSRRCYLSYFNDSELQLMLSGSHESFAAGELPRAQRCVLETPIINRDDAAPAITIVELNIAGALLAGAVGGGNVVTCTPKEWKGNRAKPPHHLEIWETLTPKERLLFPTDTLERIERGIDLNSIRYYKKPLRQYDFEVTNWLDSTGIGLVDLGRLKP